MNLTERIGDFIDERANAEEGWNGQVIAFRDFVEMELQEQRQRDADIVTEMELDTTTAFTYQQLRVNILNSREE